MIILQRTISLHLALSVMQLFDGAGFIFPFMFCCPFILVLLTAYICYSFIIIIMNYFLYKPDCAHI